MVYRKNNDITDVELHNNKTGQVLDSRVTTRDHIVNCERY